MDGPLQRPLELAVSLTLRVDTAYKSPGHEGVRSLLAALGLHRITVRSRLKFLESSSMNFQPSRVRLVVLSV